MTEETKPCITCKRPLEPVNGDWKKMQPYGGCELQIIGAFGSAVLDNNIGPTVYRGVICDACTSAFVKYMEEKPTPCRGCGGKPSKEEHTCPYAEEINGDDSSLCNCCDDCSHECAMDI